MDETLAAQIISDTQNLYNTIAEDFSVTRDKVSADMMFVAEYAQGARRVLDVGCGNGRLLPLLPASVVYYCGVDHSGALVEGARTRYNAEVASGRAEFVEGSMLAVSELGFNEPFDIVYALASLHHIPSWGFRQSAFLEMANQVKTGGKLLILNWNLHSGYAVKRYGLDLSVTRPGYDAGDVFIPWKDPAGGDAVQERYCHAFTLSELETLVNTAGLTLEKNEYIKDGKPSNQKDAKFLFTVCKKI